MVAIAHPDNIEDYARVDERGALISPQSLKNKRYAWLAAHYKAGSDNIKRLKDAINEYGAHASVVQTMHNFREPLGAEPFFGTSFFDAEDDYYVKTDLWRAANVGLCVLDLLYGVNRDFEVLTFATDYVSRVQELIKQHEALGEEMRATERFQKVQRKLAEGQD